MLWELFFNFRKKKGKKRERERGAKSHMLMFEFEMLCSGGAVKWRLRCYLNICGPGLKRFKDALGFLCADAVQRPDAQKENAGE